MKAELDQDQRNERIGNLSFSWAIVMALTGMLGHNIEYFPTEAK